MRSFALLLLLAAFSGCPTKPKCDATSCSSGCCDANGTCQTGDSASACGTGGALCSACLSGACSNLRICVGGTGGGGGGGTTGGGGGSTTGGGTGGGGTTGGGGGSSGTRTVTISRTVTFTDERGTQMVDRLGDGGVTVTLPDGGVLAATRTGASYLVPNVPAGEYVVRFGNTFYVAQTDTLDLGFTTLGRPDNPRIDAGVATLTLASAGLPAWNDLDLLMLFSQGADLYAWNGPLALTSGPMAGQVPTAFSWDYGALNETSTPRLDAAQGDTLWAQLLAYQPLITTPVAGAADDGGVLDVDFECNVSAAAAHVTGVTINPGTNAGAASFTTTPSQSIGVTFPRTQWEARAPEAHPQAVLYVESLYVASEPAADTASADLISCLNFPTLGGNPVSDINRSVTVVNPFPAGWRPYGFAELTYRINKQVADAGTWSSTGTSTVQADLNQPLAPGVHAPTQLQVQSIAADQLVTVATAAPLTVSWQPGAAPSPTRYYVSLLSITRDMTGTHRRVIVGALTRGTRFSFPAGFLTLGGIYQVRVRAEISTGLDSSPNLGRVTSASDAFTNPFLAQ